LTAPDRRGTAWEGNWECLCDLMLAPMKTESGSFLGGPSFMMRRNLLSLGGTVVPYVQAGAGFLLTDAFGDRDRAAFGQAFNFTVAGHLGVRWFVARDLSLDLEGGYQYIFSPNGSSGRHGIHALGAQIGLTYHFPWGR
ncbi:MAG: acyloxyacyl hydrolase, partial [Nitrospira sp.]|nr:acyloxyacyl hydrolase [Nitrospira sp.]